MNPHRSWSRLLLAPCLGALFVGGLALMPIGFLRGSTVLVRSRLAQLLPACVAAFVLAHGASFDPYYAPFLRRFWDAYEPGAGLVGFVAAAGIGLSTLAWFRAGRWLLPLTALLMFAGWFSAVLVGVH